MFWICSDSFYIYLEKVASAPCKQRLFVLCFNYQFWLTHMMDEEHPSKIALLRNRLSLQICTIWYVIWKYYVKIIATVFRIYRYPVCQSLRNSTRHWGILALRHQRQKRRYIKTLLLLFHRLFSLSNCFSEYFKLGLTDLIRNMKDKRVTLL